MTIAETYRKTFVAPGVSDEVATVLVERMQADAAATEKDGEDGQYIFTFSDNSTIRTKELWAHKNERNNL
jgi:hypothetical protein